MVTPPPLWAAHSINLSVKKLLLMSNLYLPRCGLRLLSSCRLPRRRDHSLFSGNCWEHKVTSVSFSPGQQPWLPLLFLIRPVLQTPPQLCCPSLGVFQPFSASLLVRCPELDTVLLTYVFLFPADLRYRFTQTWLLLFCCLIFSIITLFLMMIYVVY